MAMKRAYRGTIEEVDSFVDNLEQLTDTGLVRQTQGYLIERVYRGWASDVEHKLKVHIRVDHSYPFQSQYYVDRWDGSQWQRVVRLPGETRGRMPHKDSADERLLDATYEIEAEMLNDAVAVIL